MAKLTEIIRYSNQLLEVGRFKDYCPNGLQVQGREDVQHIVSGVTACQALIEQAISLKADLLLVHHGYFWRSEDPTITGIKRKRIQALLDNDISLAAYHLPLDAHPQYGNNAELGRLLGIEIDGCLEDADLVMHGRLKQKKDAAAFVSAIEKVLGRKPQHLSGGKGSIERIAWCSGGAQNYFEQAIAAGVDMYITGEVSEQNFHLAQEWGVDFVAAGHHATERYGVQALGQHLSKEFAIKHTFADVDNPV